MRRRFGGAELLLGPVLVLCGCVSVKASSPLAKSLAGYIRPFQQWSGLSPRRTLEVSVVAPAEFERIFREQIPCASSSRSASRLTAFGIRPLDTSDSLEIGLAFSSLQGAVVVSHRSRDQILVRPGGDLVPDFLTELASLSLSKLGWAQTNQITPDRCWSAAAFRKGTSELFGLTGALHLKEAIPAERMVMLPPESFEMVLRGMSSFADEHAVQMTPYSKRLRSFYSEDSLRFAEDLARKGGLDILRQAAKHPPVSSNQLLHLENYLSGKQPIPIKPPILPAGWTVLESGQLGELGILEMFASCPSLEKKKLDGWAGDQYTVAEDRTHHRALLWATAWDSAGEAAHFAEHLGIRVECGDHSMIANDEVFRGDYRIKRRRERVAFVRGLPDKQSLPMAESLFDLVGDPLPNAPPFDLNTRRPIQ